ncbi:MAG: hypothetical protein ABIA76_01730 [Candidatus Diapherotrites archaeon]
MKTLFGGKNEKIFPIYIYIYIIGLILAVIELAKPAKPNTDSRTRPPSLVVSRSRKEGDFGKYARSFEGRELLKREIIGMRDIQYPSFNRPLSRGHFVNLTTPDGKYLGIVKSPPKLSQTTGEKNYSIQLLRRFNEREGGYVNINPELISVPRNYFSRVVISGRAGRK